VKTGANDCSRASKVLVTSMAGGFRAGGIESLKLQSPLSRAAFSLPISVSKCAKLELTLHVSVFGL
jgi:hypothetical protein